MENKNNNLKLAKRMILAVFIAIPVLSFLMLLLKDTNYIKIVSWLVGIMWLVVAIFSVKYFVQMIRDIFK